MRLRLINGKLQRVYPMIFRLRDQVRLKTPVDFLPEKGIVAGYEAADDGKDFYEKRVLVKWDDNKQLWHPPTELERIIPEI